MSTNDKTFCIVYRSEASMFVDENTIDELLQTAEQRNAQYDVTGILLADWLHFIQHLEGPKEGLRTIFEKIQGSPLHSNLTVLFDREIDHRVFPQFFMGVKLNPDVQLLRHITEEWTKRLEQSPSIKYSVNQIYFMREFFEQLT